MQLDEVMVRSMFSELDSITKNAGALDKAKKFIDKGRKEGFIFLKPQHRAKTGPREVFGKGEAGKLHKRTKAT